MAGAFDDTDVLVGAEWSCASTPAGACSGPADLDGPDLHWMPATVPGTVAGALRNAGEAEPSAEWLDGRDWWFRCRFAGPARVTPGPDSPEAWVLSCEGLATLADLWLNGRHLLGSESMFSRHRVAVGPPAADNELCIRFAALTPVLERRRPRPRWKTSGIGSQNLRWIRTTLLGRQGGWAAVPVPVGPWRPLHLRRASPIEVTTCRLRSACLGGPDGSSIGTVSVELDVSGYDLSVDRPAPTARLEVHGVTSPMTVSRTDGGLLLTGSVIVDGVDRWWPHTHGGQPLYPVRAVVGGVPLDLGDVGFRTVTVDRSDGGFRLLVNEVPVFCRGAGWYPIDPVSLQYSDDALASSIGLALAGGLNMLRIPGDTVYEDQRFFAMCDREGILVWQDAMLGPVDPPADEEFLATIRAEVSELLDRTAGHPSAAVLCGGQQIEEQAAMFGLPRERWPTPVIDSVLPDLVSRSAPGLVYVTSSPTGGDLPFQSDVGVSHYVGVGVLLFPLEDLRRAAPRFVSEGFAFSNPPERVTVDEEFGDDLSTGNEQRWKLAVHGDPGSRFDLEDVRNHYVDSFFAEDVAALWKTDVERALDLGRAAVAEVAAASIAEWRRPGSPCDGMLTIALRDLRPGPGWGLVDSTGRPKAPWYTLARGSAPVAVLATDEGVNGLAFHLVNDTAEAIEGTLELGLHTAVHRVEAESSPVTVPARGAIEVRAEGLFDGFRDLTYAYRFGPRTYELVTADLVDAAGTRMATTGYLPGGPGRDMDPDVGLQAGVEPADGGVWLLHVSSRRFAQYVHVDVPGFVASDSWFHLPPGGARTVLLRPDAGSVGEPMGRVRALNSAVPCSVSP
ncbi:MAG: glycosyl hydrolase [Acidimicrobiales bacterium]